MRYISFRFFPERFSSMDQAARLLFERAFFASWGRIPRFTNVELRDDLLILRPDISGTGTVHVPMVHPQYGIMLQSSETLRQREKPYNLLKELGRGKLGRLMRSLYEWNINGFTVAEEDHDNILKTLHDFGVMATSCETDAETDQSAWELLQRLDMTVLDMTQKYFDQMFAFQKRRFHRNPNHYVPLEIGLFRTTEFLRNQDNAGEPYSFLGEREQAAPVSENPHDISLEDTTNVFVNAENDPFEYVAAIPCWKDLEPQPGQFRFEHMEEQIRQIENSGRKPIIGPVLTFDPGMMPRWALTRIDQREAFENAALNMTIQLAKRFGPRCFRWVVASRVFSCPKCGFSVGRGVSLVCDMITAIKKVVPGGVVLAGLDQPLGDFYCSYNCPLPFIAIVESLASVPGLDGFVLEVHLGMNPGDTLVRDPMVLSRMFDIWGLWRKKLYISLSVSNEWDFFPEKWSHERLEQVQGQWITLLIQLCLMKRNVCGIFWDSLAQSTPLFESIIKPLNTVPSRVK